MSTLRSLQSNFTLTGLYSVYRIKFMEVVKIKMFLKPQILKNFHCVIILSITCARREVMLLIEINILVRYGGMGGFPC